MKKRVVWWCLMGAGFLLWMMVFIQTAKAGADTEILKPDAATASADSMQRNSSDSASTVVTLETDTIMEESLHGAAESTIKPGTTTGGCVQVNTADAAELQTLQGIGPVLAQRIIEFRATGGKFTTPADLIKVKGIGEGKLKKIRDRLCF